MGFFKFLKKKKGEGKDLTSEMTFEDIPPAPKPFEMEKKAEPFGPPPVAVEKGIQEFPEVPRIKEEKEAVEIPTIPETLGPEINAPPMFGPEAEESKEEKIFEKIPFPGVKKKEPGEVPERVEPVLPGMPGKEEVTPPPPHEEPKPPVMGPPPLPKEEEKPIEKEFHPAPKIEKREEIKPPLPKKIEHEEEAPPKEVDEEKVEFKYLKERTDVDFSKPLFLNSDQCSVILENIDAMRAGLGECDKSSDILEEIRSKSDKKYQKLRTSVEDVQKKLFNIDKILFNQ